MATGRSLPPLAAVRRCRASRAAQRAEHRADDAGAQSPMNVWMRGAADDRAGEGARDEPGAELRRRLAARRLRQLIGDQLDQQEDGQHGDGDRMGHPLRPLAVDVDPAQERAPGHHRRSCQRAQTGDHTDQQSEQHNE